MAKVAVFSDSQGRGIADKIYFLSNKTVIPTGMVLTSAKLLEIIENAKKSTHDHVVLIGGTVDSLKGTIKEIYENLEENLESLKTKKFVCLTTIPKRHDLPADDPIHEELVLVNHYIAEVAARIKNTKVVDIQFLLPHYHTAHGLHFNEKGKIKVASLVLNEFMKSVENHLRPQKETWNKSKTGVLLNTDSIEVSKCPSGPLQEPLINPTTRHEVEGENAQSSSFSELVEFHSPKDSECFLEAKQESSKTNVQLRNEQNSALDGMNLEFNLKDVIYSESPKASTTQESKFPMTTSSTFQACVDNLHHSKGTSSLKNMKTSHSKGINVSCNFIKTRMNNLKRKSKQKNFLHGKNMQHTTTKEAKNCMKKVGSVKRLQKLLPFLINRNHTSNNCENGFNIPSYSSNMLESRLSYDEENNQENTNESNKEVVKIEDVPKYLFLFQNLNSFFQYAILVVGLYLFLTEFTYLLISDL